MSKVLVTNYTFNAAAKTVTFSDYGSISLENVLLITNVTDNLIVYNFAQVGKGGTVSGNILTLDYDTTSMDNSDDLQIYYDDPSASSVVSGTITANLGTLNGAATSAKQDTGNTSLSSIDGKTPALGQALAAASVPVVLTASQLTTLTPPAAITGFATLSEQQTQTASLSVLDDWDESDRAKVNLIVGQAGIAGGTGIDGATVPRVTLATNVALPSGDNTIGRFKITDGTDVADVLSLSNSKPLTVAVVDASGNQVTSFGGSGGTSTQDDSAFTAASGSGTPIMGFVTSDSVDSGDVGVVGMLGNRQLKVTLFDSSGSELSIGGGTQYIEDAAAAASPTGTVLNLIRNDARSGSLTTTDGDNVSARGTNSGELYVKHVDSITVDAGTNLNTSLLALESGGNLADIASSLSLLDDTVFAEDSVSGSGDKGVSILAVRTDTPGNSSDADGDYEPLQISGGRLWVAARVDNTVNVGGTIAVTQSGTWDEVGINDSGNSITVDQPTGTNLHTVVDSGTITTVSAVTAISNALPAGTNAIGKLAANSGVDIGDVDVTSLVPGTSATSLGKAEDGAHTTGDTGVMALGVRVDTPNTALSGTDGDYTPVATTSTGAVRPAPMSEDFAALANGPQVKKYYTNAGAVTDGIVWSPAAGKRWYVTDIFVNVSAAATITLEDDKTGGDEVVWKAELAANSGWSHAFNTPLFSGEDAADLLVTTSAGNVYITITGYEI